MKHTHTNPGCDVTVDPRPPIDDSFRSRKMKAESKTTLEILEEIEAGITAYEDEHKSHMAHDDCNGMYIPINVVRRLIAVRKLKESEQRAGERG